MILTILMRPFEKVTVKVIRWLGAISLLNTGCTYIFIIAVLLYTGMTGFKN